MVTYHMYMREYMMACFFFSGCHISIKAERTDPIYLCTMQGVSIHNYEIEKYSTNARMCGMIHGLIKCSSDVSAIIQK
jgi:hypothetical protein